MGKFLITLENSVENLLKQENVLLRSPESIRLELQDKIGVDLHPIKHFLQDMVLRMAKELYDTTIFPYPFVQTEDFTPDFSQLEKVTVLPELQIIIGSKTVYREQLEMLVWDYARTHKLVKNTTIIRCDAKLSRICFASEINPKDIPYDRFIVVSEAENEEESPHFYAMHDLIKKHSKVRLWKCSDDLKEYLGISFTTHKGAMERIKQNLAAKDIKAIKGIISCDPALEALTFMKEITKTELAKIVRMKLLKCSKYQIDQQEQYEAAKFLALLDSETLELQSTLLPNTFASKYSSMVFYEPTLTFSYICPIKFFPK